MCDVHHRGRRVGRNKLKRDGSKMLFAGVEVTPPAGSLTACLGSFHMELFLLGWRQGKQLANVHALICCQDMFTSLMISVIIRD